MQGSGFVGLGLRAGVLALQVLDVQAFALLLSLHTSKQALGSRVGGGRQAYSLLYCLLVGYHGEPKVNLFII